MNKDEALKLALEALEEAWYHVGTFQPTEKAIDLYDEARTAIKEALMSVPDGAQPEHGWTPERIAGMARLKDAQDKRLAQPSVSVEQEPVAWINKMSIDVPNQPLYTAPHTWVGLTDDEIDQGLLRSDYAFKTAEAWRAGVVFAMTKLKEKNT